MPAMAGEAYLAPDQGDVEARKKVDQIEGPLRLRKSDVRSRLIDAGRQPTSAFAAFGSLKAIRRWIGPCGDKLST